MNKKFDKYSYLKVPVICLLFGISTAMIVYKVPPIFTLMIEDFSVDAQTMSWLMTVIMVSGIFLAIPVGFLEKRFGATILIKLAVIACVCGCLLSGLSEWIRDSAMPILIISRFLEGISYIFCATCMPIVVSRSVPKHRVGVSTSIWGLWCNVGGIVANTVCPTLYYLIGFGWMMIIFACINALTFLFMYFVLFKVFHKTSDEIAETEIESTSFTNSTHLVEFIMLMFSWCLLNFLCSSIRNYTPTCLQYQLGISPELAGIASSITLFVSIFACVVYGKVADKLGSYKWPYAAGCILLGISAYMIFVQTQQLFVVGTIIAGIAFGSQAVSAMAVFELLPPKWHAVGIGIGMTVCCIGQSLGNNLTQDLVGNDLSNWQLAGYTMMIIAIISFVIAIITGLIGLKQKK